MKRLRYVLCDVFTDRALEGNPLAVFTDGRSIDAERMQRIAREMNLSETAFLLPPTEGGHARLRIFTPSRELSFAGHPTLGTAFVLGGPMEATEVRLETGAGVVPVRLEREGPRVTFGWMRQPFPRMARFDEEAALLAALGLGRSLLPVEVYDNGSEHVYVALERVESVSGLRPNFEALATFGPGINTFALSLDGAKTRMFHPAAGVNEDPATGSAAGPLALHLVRHGRLALGDTIRIRQGEEIGRPSELFARVTGENDIPSAVEVGGAAVIVGRGELVLP